jgi:hypothetical protein
MPTDQSQFVHPRILLDILRDGSIITPLGYHPDALRRVHQPVRLIHMPMAKKLHILLADAAREIDIMHTRAR